MLSELGHSILLKLPAETAHNIGRFLMRFNVGAPGIISTPRIQFPLFDRRLDNPLGLAAGFDKYATLAKQAQNYGFGWVECGSFTLGGGEGNPKPRLFRTNGGSLLNRMGLNNCSSAVAAARLSSLSLGYDPNECGEAEPFAVSIAKTHDPKIMGDTAIRDIATSYELLKNLGIYTCINLSCPNTREGITFEDPSALTDLLSGLHREGKRRPLVLKLSPGLFDNASALDALLAVSEDFVDGYQAVNTKSIEHSKFGKGGQSGPELFMQTRKAVSMLRERTDKAILAVGGVDTVDRFVSLYRAGADACLAYTGFVYGGPKFAYDINYSLDRNYPLTSMSRLPIIDSKTSVNGS